MFCSWWTSKSCWVCLQNISTVRSLLPHCYPKFTLSTFIWIIGIAFNWPPYFCLWRIEVYSQSVIWTNPVKTQIIALPQFKTFPLSIREKKKSKSLQGPIYPYVIWVIVADRLPGILPPGFHAFVWSLPSECWWELWLASNQQNTEKVPDVTPVITFMELHVTLPLLADSLSLSCWPSIAKLPCCELPIE